MAEHPRERGLILIGVFRLAKALALVAAGILVLFQLHGSAARMLVSAAQHLRVDPDNKLIHAGLQQLLRLDHQKLEALGIGTFFYAAVFTVEGVGLLLAKRWAEYVTLGVTASFVPLEVFEMVKRPNALKAATVVLNVVIVVYLSWRLRRRRLESR